MRLPARLRLFVGLATTQQSMTRWIIWSLLMTRL